MRKAFKMLSGTCCYNEMSLNLISNSTFQEHSVLSGGKVSALLNDH